MRGFRTGGLAAVGVLALVAFTSAPAPRTLKLAASPEEARLGLVSSGTGTALVRLDPVSLKRSGRPLELNGYSGAWAFAPDGRVLAIAVRPSTTGSNDTLRFFTVAGPGRTRRGISLGGAAAALMWVRSDRLLAYVNEYPGGTTSILAIDPGTGRIVARTRIEGSVMHIARTDDSLVLLVADTNRIGPSRLVVVDGEGASRTAKLDGIVAGTTWPDEKTNIPVGTRQIPGLAIDGGGNRAFVIPASGPVAEIDLGSLAVSLHRQSASRAMLDRVSAWLTPSAEAKGMNGPALTALLLGDGLLAVAGSDESAVQEGGKLQVSARPLGLRIVDTRDWTVRILDPGADAFAVADDVLLATGSSWSSEPQTQTGMGVAAYGSDRALRFHLLPGRAAWIGFVYRGRAYVSVQDESALRIVDLASGRIVGSRRAESPWPLLGESSPLFR